MDTEEIENRIWGRPSRNAQAKGIIPQKEAEFLPKKYLEEFREKNG